ncbi:ATP-dependent helicase HepA [Pirellulimonas nuda]|uniref:ATP-dependent helicase HepA n=1 Tax=Pirellulimonas nuda TaxID=2528009 RepID=A0A518DA42_9BACT|nr:DEAD/DEAH box helicase [Pirellulimonas nuda]QDU88308.1 ATP-dependent helicase HepA [Pirellulimonas nuda]
MYGPLEPPQVRSVGAAQLCFGVTTAQHPLHAPRAAATAPWATDLEPPTVLSLKPDGYAVRVSGCLMPEAGPVAPTAPRAAAGPRQPRRGGGKRTRVRPPTDVVRLQDRLQYLLQPPLESLIAQESLAFPFEPFDYQYDGVAFLFPRRHAILADEMGLGKTMQAITAIRLLARAGRLTSALLICPKPLVSNWRREFSLWAPELSVAVIDGKQSVRAWAWREASAVVRISNYEAAVRDLDMITGAGPYDLVMLDEAQRVKNASSATAQAVRSIPRTSSWALTGTPIENSIEDLVSILEFVSPGAAKPGTPARALAPMVRDLVLRRRKEQVLADMPPKLVSDEQVDLTPEQWEAYTRAEEEGVVALDALGKEVDLKHVFQLVLRLKQICNFDPVTGASGKLDRLEAELEECVASGRKAIVFSQWVGSLEKIAARIGRFHPLEYHGRVPHSRRDGVIERFRDDPACGVILMSYGAGSVGLNLQFAQYVFLFDRWWNPAVEDQAINRAHRIGAAGTVTVTRYLAAGTIEERIDRVLSEKRALAEAVLGADGPPASYGLTRDDLLELFQRPRSKAAA